MLSLDKSKELLSTAHRHFEDGNYDLTLPLLNTLINSGIKRPEVFHMFGTIYYEQGKFKQAIQSFKRALEIDPTFTDSSLGLSVILNDLGKYEEAREIFLEAQENLKKKRETDKNSKLEIQIINKHRELADLYSRSEQYKQAIQHLVEIENIKGPSEDLLLDKVSLYKAMRNFDFAVEILEEWIKQSQPSQATLFSLAQLYFLNRLPLKALSTCEELLELSPEHKEAKKFYEQIKSTTFDLRGEQKI